MPLVIPAGYSAVTHAFAIPSPKAGAVATINFGTVASPSQALCSSLSNAFAVNFQEVLLSDKVTFLGTTMRDQEEAYEHTVGTPGEVPAGLASPNTALLVRKTTAKVGRKNRGRMFVPGMLYETDVQDNGTLEQDTVTLYQSHFDAWLADLNVLLAGMVILHTDNTEPTLVESLVVESTVATQRRRLR